MSQENEVQDIGHDTSWESVGTVMPTMEAPLEPTDSRVFANTLRNRRARQKSALLPLRWLPRVEELAPGEIALIGAQVDMSQFWLSVPRRTMRSARRKSLGQRQREFDRDLIHAACDQASRWPAEMRLLVSLQDDQAPDSEFNARVRGILQETGFPARRLDIVFQETGLAQDDAETRYALACLRDQGSQIYLGGFGAPPSSLTLLRERGVSGLIDGVQFDVSQMNVSSPAWDGRGVTELDESSATFYKGILQAVTGIGLKVRATGVDTPALLEFARSAGCDEMSGTMIAAAETGPQLSERFDLLSGRSRKRRMGRTAEGL